MRLIFLMISDVLKAMILASDGREERHIDRIAQLEKLLADFKRALFGAKSEKAEPGQFELALEDIETAVESIQAAEEADDRQVEGKPRPRKTNRGALSDGAVQAFRCPAVVCPSQTMRGGVVPVDPFQGFPFDPADGFPRAEKVDDFGFE